MAGDKGKSRDHELSEVNGNMKTVYSATVASAASLIHNVFSTTTNYEMLENTIGAFAGLNKGQLSTSSSAGSSYIEGRVDILPKLSQSHGFHGMKRSHHEQYLPDSEKEYSRFLSNSDSFLPSQFSQIESLQTKDSHTAFCITKTSKLINPSIIEQENRDGEDIVNILTSFGQEDCDHEASEVVNTFNSLLFGGTNNDSELNLEENLDCFTQQPVNLLEKSPFNFLPSFENPGVHHYQWINLQENYAEKVWGDCWEAIGNLKQANKNSIQIKFKQPQNMAKRRLKAICCHLRQKNPKLEP